MRADTADIEHFVKEPLPDRRQTASILEAYFEGPHNFCFSAILHRPTFMAMLENGLVSHSLLLIVLATGMRSLDPSATSADRWADECRGLIVPQIFRRMSTVNLQTLLLLQRYEWHRGSVLSSFFLSALAIRLAFALELHLEPTERPVQTDTVLPPSVLETRRRLIWSCFIMESVPDAGTRRLYSAMDPFAIQARLPSDESCYQRRSGTSAVQPTLAELWSDRHTTSVTAPNTCPSISAYLIKMAVLRMKILHYVNSDVNGNEPLIDSPPWLADSPFHDLQRKLEHFYATLPGELQLTVNMKHFTDQSPIPLYTLHIMYFAASADLFRIGIQARAPARRAQTAPPEHFIDLCRRGRIENALNIIKVVRQFLEGTATEHDPFIAICSCLAIRIISVEGQNTVGNPSPLLPPSVAEDLQLCVQCAARTARWSKPIQKLLFAANKLARLHGFFLDVPDFVSSVSGNPTHPPSRQGSPTLNLYGTFGEVAKSRAADDLEASKMPTSSVSKLQITNSVTKENNISAPVALNADGNSSNIPHMPLPTDYGDTEQGISPDTLRLAADWGNGLYDIDWAMAQFDQWANIDFSWGEDLVDTQAPFEDIGFC
ncbi:uncharacterized protein PV07_07820 [Cladophialophora immunda]|uniref:Xylanolytic transcriptional activator regulatory domain-containing protein n=1 Tax=Cladophialophora immunda TaxID=569365 RepID=A0A0D2CAP5_9EURO|nr:uncharacterized protein PV07_07820 [Cladophialophora immunda]KIW28138.1 hypothetical protein PV07_07820 [Cladophialophora immunda]OQV00414.1 Fungal specific transcription factor domain-containing protein [Cladophialophora immunda]